MPIRLGRKLGRYEIRAQLGSGGMGEVYLAHDAKLDRRIALKILPDNVASDQKRMRRFIQEAKAASALNHPSIITIYEVEQSDAINFISMEFIEGETLRQRLKHTLLTTSEVLDVAIQVASALAAAHKAGIVHRDIKPENIMLRPDGLVKVLDFGLAKLAEWQDSSDVDTQMPTKTLLKTDPGVVMGTTAYMSPEQARGREVDARTDIFSIGVVIYEMLSGRVPFAGETTADMIAALLHKEPHPLRELAPYTPAELQHIVSKALRKNRDERYETAKGLFVDLKTLKQELDFTAKLERSAAPEQTNGVVTTLAPATGANAMESSVTRAARAGSTSSREYVMSGIKRHRRIFTLALPVLLLALGFTYWNLSPRPSVATQIESIAILPFINASGNADVEYLSDGMTESLINSLSQLPRISVKARSSVFRYKGKEVETQQVASELSVQALLNGRVLQRGEDLTLYLSLVDGRNGNQLWGEQYNRKLTDLVTLQNEIVRDVSEKLRARLSVADQQKLTKRYTANREAYQLYLKGRYSSNKWTAEGFQKGIEYFNQAIALDTDYALAYAGLADCYYGLSTSWLPPREVMPKMKEAALKAVALDESLAEAHSSLSVALAYHDLDWLGAEKEIRRAIELDPNNAQIHLVCGDLFANLGRFDEAMSEFKKAQELDPTSAVVTASLAYHFVRVGDYDRAIKESEKALELQPGDNWPLGAMAFAYLYKGEAAKALAMFQKQRVEGLPTSGLEGIGRSYAAMGERAKALKIIEELKAASKREYVSSFPIATIYLQLGDRDKAIEYLEKTYEERNTNSLFLLKTDRQFDVLRSDLRFIKLLRELNFAT